MANLAAALRAPDGDRAALEAIRELIDRIEVKPAAAGKELEIELVGGVAAMVRLGMSEASARPAVVADGRDLFERSVKVVAGRGFEPLTFRL